MGLMTHEVALDLPYKKGDCFTAAKEAINELGHKITGENEALGTIHASTKMTMTSTTWGDIITITISGTDGQCRMMVNSTAKAPTLLAGRQQIKNVQMFSDALTRHLASCETVNPSPAAAPGVTAADEIRKYKELLDLGAITQDEFDAKKKQLLGL